MSVRTMRSADGKPAAATAMLSPLGAARTVFLSAGLFSLAINILMLAAPLYALQIYDRVLSSRNVDTLIMLTLVVVGAFAALALLEAVRGTLFNHLAVRLEQALGGRLIRAAIADAGAPGQSSTQGLRDLANVRNFLTGPALQTILDAPWAPVFILAVLLIHPFLGLLALVGAVVLFALAVVNEMITRRPLARATDGGQAALQRVEAAARNADVIGAMGMLPQVIARWSATNDEALSEQARADSRRVRVGALARFIRLSLQVGMLGIGGLLAIEGTITPGAMIAASILMGRALAPVDMAIASWRATTSARAAYARIRRALQTAPAEPQDAMPLPRPEGRLVAKDMMYVYPGQQDPTLRNIDFGLEPGEALGIVGPSAAGKTTLARLLVGSLAPRLGRVTLDEADIAQWDPADRGHYVGYLPQGVELFPGSVRENIARMGDGDPDEIIAAARLVGAHQMILGLPQGYETIIGENGGLTLSGGQRQWIGLARAVYGNPSLVVLDEPNASLDGAGEQAVLEAIEKLKSRGTAVVVIAHRANVLQKVDKIMVLGFKTVEMLGPREQIIHKLMTRAHQLQKPKMAEADHG